MSSSLFWEFHDYQVSENSSRQRQAGCDTTVRAKPCSRRVGNRERRTARIARELDVLLSYGMEVGAVENLVIYTKTVHCSCEFSSWNRFGRETIASWFVYRHCASRIILYKSYLVGETNAFGSDLRAKRVRFPPADDGGGIDDINYYFYLVFRLVSRIQRF